MCKIALICQFYTQLFVPKRHKYALDAHSEIVCTNFAGAIPQQKTLRNGGLIMKKLLTCLFALVMSLSVLTGCGDAVADEFETFLNTDMVSVNAKYNDLKEELAKWENFETDAEMIDSLNNVIIPNIDEQLAMLDAIELTTDEVTEIKAKYKTMLEKYKEGYSAMLTALKAADVTALENSLTIVQEGLTALEEYNKALEDLAAEKGMTVGY